MSDLTDEDLNRIEAIGPSRGDVPALVSEVRRLRKERWAVVATRNASVQRAEATEAENVRLRRRLAVYEAIEHVTTADREDTP